MMENKLYRLSVHLEPKKTKNVTGSVSAATGHLYTSQAETEDDLRVVCGSVLVLHDPPLFSLRNAHPGCLSVCVCVSLSLGLGEILKGAGKSARTPSRDWWPVSHGQTGPVFPLVGAHRETAAP